MPSPWDSGIKLQRYPHLKVWAILYRPAMRDWREAGAAVDARGNNSRSLRLRLGQALRLRSLRSQRRMMPRNSA